MISNTVTLKGIQKKPQKIQIKNQKIQKIQKFQ